jgi:hypothetical protein
METSRSERLSIDFLSKANYHIKNKFAELDIILNNIKTIHQKKKVEDLLKNEEYIMIIFDACRYDYFEEMYGEHFIGELEKVYNTNTYTKQYQQSMWTGQYDITYIAGGPVITDRNFQLSNLDYRPSNHFDQIVDVWDMGYEKELGVTPPEAVTEVALDCKASQMIVHYFQPHTPYIGDVRIREDAPADESKDSKIEKRKKSVVDIYNRIESGEVNNSELKKAYKSNLTRVMLAAKSLVDQTDKKVIITSDHGELLGEDGRYLHGGLPHKILCELPWFEASGTKGETEMSLIDKSSDDSNKDISEQLQDLGYL